MHWWEWKRVPGSTLIVNNGMDGWIRITSIYLCKNLLSLSKRNRHVTTCISGFLMFSAWRLDGSHAYTVPLVLQLVILVGGGVVFFLFCCLWRRWLLLLVIIRRNETKRNETKWNEMKLRKQVVVVQILHRGKMKYSYFSTTNSYSCTTTSTRVFIRGGRKDRLLTTVNCSVP